jgi:hypothetical protein
MPQVGRMTRQQISTLTLALALGLTSPLSAEAGGFRTGTYQTNDSSSSHRNITSGMEEIRSERTYTNTINGSSRVDHMELALVERHVVKQHTTKAMATESAISATAMARRLNRARRKLRDALEPNNRISRQQ